VSFIEKVLRRRSHYRAAFATPSGQKVLADLARFCRHGESPIQVSNVRQQVDPVATAVRIGRQEVFQRILTHLHIDDSQLLRMKDQSNDD
jgi:hypothetical protein